jgi:hypothetical protein
MRIAPRAGLRCRCAGGCQVWNSPVPVMDAVAETGSALLEQIVQDSRIFDLRAWAGRRRVHLDMDIAIVHPNATDVATTAEASGGCLSRSANSRLFLSEIACRRWQCLTPTLRSNCHLLCSIHSPTSGFLKLQKQEENCTLHFYYVEQLCCCSERL